MLLEHKKAVIYGAGGAIGGAVARAFAREGATVFLAGRTRAPVEAIAREIAAAGGVAEAAAVDALDETAVEQHIDEVATRADGIDILFNAIGMDDVQGRLLVDMSAEEVAQPVIKATRTQFLTARAAARRILQQGSGVILSVTVAPTPVPTTAAMGLPAPRWKGSGGPLPQSLDHTGSAWLSCARPGRRTRPTSSRPSSDTPGPPGSLPRSSWPRPAAGPCLAAYRSCRRWPRPRSSWRRIAPAR
jgi:Enoyl-(Acyl carrier protein) reductase